MKRLLIVETIHNLAGASEGKAIEQGLKLMVDYTDQRSVRHLKIEPCQEAYTKSKFLKLFKRDVDYLQGRFRRFLTLPYARTSVILVGATSNKEALD